MLYKHFFFILAQAVLVSVESFKTAGCGVTGFSPTGQTR